MSRKEILILDFSKYLSSSSKDNTEFIEGIGTSLKNTGFVVCKNLGLESIMQQVLAQEILLFETLTFEQKMSLFQSETRGERGFVPLGGETAIGKSFPDLKEYFEFGRENDSRYDRNIWPSTSLLPNFKSTLLEAYTLNEEKSHQILEAIAQYVGFNKHELKEDTTLGNSVMRLIFYPNREYLLNLLKHYREINRSPIDQVMVAQMHANLSNPDTPPEAIRAAAHKDSNYKTIVAVKEGLQVLVDPNADQENMDNWYTLPSIPGAYAINIGQKLEIKTGLPATIHRVINPTLNFTKHRYNETFFNHPHAECILDKKSGLTDKQYMDDLLRRRYTGV